MSTLLQAFQAIQETVLGFRAGSRIIICFDLRLWLRHGRPAYRSKDNVICVYEDIPLSCFRNAIDKRLDRKLLTDSANSHLLKCVQEDCLGVEADGSFSRTLAHTRIRLTPTRKVILVSREQSQEAESEQPTDPSQEEAKPLVLLPGTSTVT